jgi:thiol-disulfide isomerase/thioredoxin
MNGPRFCTSIALVAIAGILGGGSREARAADAPIVHPAAGHAWLGVAMQKTPLADGVRVAHVIRGSPADKAGLKEGDAIRAIDGTKVGTPQDVTRLVADHDPGDAIVATITRADTPMTMHVSLDARPSPDEVTRMDSVGTFAPEWVGVEPVGSAPSHVASLRGKVVLLDFWATWCGPCRFLAPRLNAMQARYGAQGLRVVGVTTDGAEKVAEFAQRAGLKYAMNVDPDGATSRAYSVSVLPTLFVIDKRGVVRDVAIGYDPGREMQIEALVKELLAEPAPDAVKPGE